MMVGGWLMIIMEYEDEDWWDKIDGIATTGTMTLNSNSTSSLGIIRGASSAPSAEPLWIHLLSMLGRRNLTVRKTTSSSRRRRRSDWAWIHWTVDKRCCMTWWYPSFLLLFYSVVLSPLSQKWLWKRAIATYEWLWYNKVSYLRYIQK